MNDPQEVDVKTVEDQIITSPSNEKKKCFRNISKGFQNRMHSFFYHLGFYIGGNPLKIIILTFVLTGLCSIGLLSYRLETRDSELFTPKETLAFEHLGFIQDNFPGTAYLRRERMIITSKKKNGDIATKHGLLSLVSVLKVSEATTAKFENRIVTLSDLCVKTIDATGISYCLVSSVLDLFYDRNFIVGSPPDFLDTVRAKINTLTDSQVKEMLSIPSYNSWNNGSLFKSKTIGKASGTGDEYKVEAFFVEMFLVDSVSKEKGATTEDARVIAWEREWIKNFVGTTIEGAEDKNIYINAIISEKDESSKIEAKDRRNIIIGYTMVFTYVCLMLGHLNRKHARITLAFFGLGSVGLAYVASMGIGSALGFPDTEVHNALLLLLFAIGIDDAFVIITAYDRTDPDLLIRQRIALTLSDAGVSISITSVTNACAFFVGSLTGLPALRSFCVWAGIGIMFIYLFQSTFFVAFATLDEYRRAKDRMDVLFCLPDKTNGELNICNQKHGALERFFAQKYAPWLFNNKVRFPILFIALGMFCTCIYGTTQLKQEFQIAWLYSGYVKTFDDVEKEYSDAVGNIINIYTGKFEYETVENQKRMAKLFQSNGELMTSKWVVENSLYSWQINFRAYASLENIEDTLEPNEFYMKLKAFLTDPVGARFANDVVFDKSTENPQIVATKSSLLSIFLENSDLKVDAMQDLRKIVNSVELPKAFPFTFAYIFFEQFAVILKEAFQIVFSSLFVVFLITFILIANPLTSIIVLLGVSFSIIDILGVLHFWNISINSVSVIVLCLAVGLTIDSAAHMGLAFMECIGTRRERMVSSLKRIGPPLLHGSISTLLAISVLIPSTSYIFQTFFKMFFLIIIFGAFHGLVVVPILLDLLGPDGYYKSEEEKQVVEFNVTKDS